MIEKEKCDELIERFKPLVYPFIGSSMLTNTPSEKVELMNAKQCALICVDEIRKELLAQYNNHYSEDTQLEIGYWCNSDECKFWTEIKSEIEKL